MLYKYQNICVYACGLSAFIADVVYVCVCICMVERVVKSRLDDCASAIERNP